MNSNVLDKALLWRYFLEAIKVVFFLTSLTRSQCYFSPLRMSLTALVWMMLVHTFMFARKCSHFSNVYLLRRWSNDGRHLVSASQDGSIKIWDAVSNRCVSTFLQAHDGSDVCSVSFSRNGKYVLSSGKVRTVVLFPFSVHTALIGLCRFTWNMVNGYFTCKR